MKGYFREWFRRALRGALLAVGFEGRLQTVRTIFLWAISVLVLYAINWRNVPMIGTGDAGVSGEVRLALSGIAAIVFLLVLMFFWQILLQPAEMHEEIKIQAEKASILQQKELDRLNLYIEGILNAEDVLLRLSSLHTDGRALYNTYNEKQEWERRMNGWNQNVESILTESFSVAAVHEFRKPGSGFEIRTNWKWEGSEDTWLKAKYSAKLYALDDLIRSATPLHLARLRTIKLE